MKTQIKYSIALVSVALMALIVGCKATLDTSGVYAQPNGGGMFLFTVDKTLVDSKDALHRFVAWEYTNRTQIQASMPALTVAADAVRANAPVWFRAAADLRDTYTSLLLSGGSGLITASNALNAQVSLINTAAVTSSALTNNIK